MLPAVSRVLRLAFDLPIDAALQPVPEEHSVDDEWFCDEAAVLLMNRERADWLRLAPEAEVARIAAEFNANELGSRRPAMDRSRRPALSA